MLILFIQEIRLSKYILLVVISTQCADVKEHRLVANDRTIIITGAEGINPAALMVMTKVCVIGRSERENSGPDRT